MFNFGFIELPSSIHSAYAACIPTMEGPHLLVTDRIQEKTATKIRAGNLDTFSTSGATRQDAIASGNSVPYVAVYAGDRLERWAPVGFVNLWFDVVRGDHRAVWPELWRKKASMSATRSRYVAYLAMVKLAKLTPALAGMMSIYSTCLDNEIRELNKEDTWEKYYARVEQSRFSSLQGVRAARASQT